MAITELDENDMHIAYDRYWYRPTEDYTGKIKWMHICFNNLGFGLTFNHLICLIDTSHDVEVNFIISTHATMPDAMRAYYTQMHIRRHSEYKD